MAMLLIPDPQAFKAAQRTQWDQSAASWNAHTPQIRAWLRQATDAMMEMARIAPGMAVLDLAAGAGDQTLDIARRVGPAGRVLATDLSPAILALARQNACQAGVDNVETRVINRLCPTTGTVSSESSAAAAAANAGTPGTSSSTTSPIPCGSPSLPR